MRSEPATRAAAQCRDSRAGDGPVARVHGLDDVALLIIAWGGPACRVDYEAGGDTMPKYVIEREIPGAGNLSAAELKAISQKSCGVLSNMGPSIQWVHSYVTVDKVYCIYNAPNEEMVREHAAQGGFPANRVSQVFSVIDPVTAE
jgi:hypothetical protein